jgi:hypothetical protein
VGRGSEERRRCSVGQQSFGSSVTEKARQRSARRGARGGRAVIDIEARDRSASSENGKQGPSAAGSRRCPRTNGQTSCFVHGEAGRRWVERNGRLGQIAREIPGEIPSLMQSLATQ